MDVLPTIWFILIAVLWIGYLFLEGFDLGVGMLLRILPKSDKERRVLLNTIGPVWDGNEVWLLTAGGATFAAFPLWYASLFSSLYIPLILVLFGLIFRAVAMEYRGKVNTDRWRAAWDWALPIGSLVAAFGVGAALALTTLGIPLNSNGDRDAGPFFWLNWEALVGGLAVVGFALIHGAVFVSLKTDGDIRKRSRDFAVKYMPFALLPIVLWVLIIQFTTGKVWTWIVVLVAVAAVVFAWLKLRQGNERLGFFGLGTFLLAGATSIFGAVYPVVLRSTIKPDEFSLTISNASSSDYTLGVMTVVAAIGVPVVLAYQIWSYWVFRKRIRVEHIPDAHDVQLAHHP